VALDSFRWAVTRTILIFFDLAKTTKVIVRIYPIKERNGNEEDYQACKCWH
jgi:hypothetical protein